MKESVVLGVRTDDYHPVIIKLMAVYDTGTLKEGLRFKGFNLLL